MTYAKQIAKLLVLILLLALLSCTRFMCSTTALNVA